MEPNAKRAEAYRLLGLAEKLLQGRDFNGSRDLALLARETDPYFEPSHQILAVADVLLAADKRINNHPDWYAILQVDRRTDDFDSIKKQYRRLAFLLHPDKNKFVWADSAFKFVADAWAVLSNTAKRSVFDNELNLFSKVDLVAMKNQRAGVRHQQFRREQEEPPQQEAYPARRTSEAPGAWSWAAPGAAAGNISAQRGSTSGEETRPSAFWTTCPYCYYLYEYPRVYADCCLRCQNCERAFHAAVIPSLPPVIPGKDAYYCCWGFFPLGFTAASEEGQDGGQKAGFPNWMPATFPNSRDARPPATAAPNGGDGFADALVPEANATPAKPPPKKRGRPRKYPLQV